MQITSSRHASPLQLTTEPAHGEVLIVVNPW